MKKISRRSFLRSMGISGLAMFVNACFPRLETSHEISDSREVSDVIPDLEFNLISTPDAVQIYPGEKTNVWRFRGEVLKGQPDNLVSIEGSYLGPIFHVNKGQVIRIHYKNELPEPSIVHWHGLHVPDEADGHPRLAIDQGETYSVTFTVKDRAGTYWYHPHPHGRTAIQVYAGMAGLFIVHDEEESELNLPQGEFDIPLVIQDKLFSSDNQFYYGSNQMMAMEGFLGNQILVNGFPDAHYSLKTGVYRFRLLNGSNSRIYQIAWDNGLPLTVIGTDGGLLETPIEKDFVTLAPAQRVDLWVDFTSDAVGTTRKLTSLPHPAPGGRETFTLMTIVVEGTSNQIHHLPDMLSTVIWEQENEAVNRSSPRSFQLSMGRGMQFLINNRVFDMDEVAKNEIVQLGDLELWEFENIATGMGMMRNMALPHPMHIHGLQFQVIERDWGRGDLAVWESMVEGCIDEGWHDTVLVHPGEKVKLLMRFADFSGLYLYHCHNLEHEDMGMMRNYRIDA